jgi:hypothetical protein
MYDIFFHEPDYNMGKVIKYRKPNPIGEDLYLDPDGATIHSDEVKIIKAQRIFKHNYWCPGGRGSRRVLEKYTRCTSHDPCIDQLSHHHEMQTTHIILSDLVPEKSAPLLPAPSVLDDSGPPENPTNLPLTGCPLRITSTYRGRLVHLENGAMVYRSHPKSLGGNGMVSFPFVESAEPETCYVEFDGQWWMGTLNFVSCPPESV